MRYSVIKRPAESDIEECFVYVAKDNRQIGLRFLVAIKDSLERLAEFPLLGKAVEFRNKKLSNVRVWNVKGFEGYLVYYTVQGNKVEVLRVLRRSRDIDALFR